MSGATVAAVIAGVGGQQPTLFDLNLFNGTPCVEASVSVRVFRNGSITTQFGCNSQVSHSPMWGGSVPRFNEGDAYQIRATVQQGGLDPEFDDAGVWITLDQTAPSPAAFWVSANIGESGTLKLLLEIRRVSSLKVVASGVFTMQYTGV